MDSAKLRELQDLQNRIHRAQIELDDLARYRKKCSKKETTFRCEDYRGEEGGVYIRYLTGTDDVDKIIAEKTILLNDLLLKFKES